MATTNRFRMKAVNARATLCRSRLEHDNKETIIKSLNEFFTMVEGFMQSYEKKAKDAEEKYRETEKKLKKKDEGLKVANKQNALLRNNLAKAKVELQDQQNQFFERLAQAISETQSQAVQHYLNLEEHKDELKDALDKGCNMYKR